MVHYAECIQFFGTTDNYNTEMFERLHIDYAKEGWRASNFRDEVPQMTKWLTHQENIAMFQSYLKYSITEEEQDVEFQDCSRGNTTSLIIASRPSISSQSIHHIQQKHNCPSFSYHLRQFLNSLLPQRDTFPRVTIPYAELPVNALDVWHFFRFTLDSLGNDVDFKEERDMVRAKLASGRQGARFDVVVVANTSDSESTGLREPLAYIEWYALGREPGRHHNMYTVSTPPPLSSVQGVLPGAVVPLRSIHQTCHLIPLTGPNISWPSSWSMENVLDKCSTFLLNNWSSKYAYQTLW
ncbi:hypothetical protein BDN67DRAFT_914326 [Paxillus ammoniavirescens]|nr:hypothetical protein BDN67DRAFT_914326 [Paxillus ammoniavirescens]